MSSEKSITVKRDCPAVMIPSGEAIILGAGSIVWLTQALGGTYTVMTDRGYMARIDSVDGDAIGILMRLFEGCAINNGLRIEYGDVGKVAFA